MSQHSKATGFHPVRHDRLIQEYQHDNYKARGKLPDHTVCPGCGAVFHDGRWQWLPRLPQGEEEMCPACHRIVDKFPAGFVHLSGDILKGHTQELMHLINRTAAEEAGEHPLERIMETTSDGDGLLITTTGIHLARRLGEALHRTHQGELTFHYNEEKMLLRVHWRR